MTSFSHPELVLLALLAEGPLHAYELVQRTRSMRVERWARVPESTLYAALRRMEDAGWVRGTVEPGARRKTKTTYRRTAAGERRLEKLVVGALSSPAPIHSDLLIGAVFASTVGRPDAIREAARRIRREGERLRKALENDRLSPQGHVILEFYLGLAELHETALRTLTRIAEDTEATDSEVPIL